jgi:hypothetical protein
MSSNAPAGLELALAVVAYHWAVREPQEQSGHELAMVEQLREAAAALPQEPVPLAELYPQVVELASLSLGLLARVGDPGEVDGLRGFEGFDLWRESRRRR